MMFAVQVDSGIRGYVRDKADKKRKQKEKILIKGKGEAEFTVISREKLPDVNLINANFIVTSETFVRALHKCTANVLCHVYGSAFTRKNCKNLLEFVKKGGNVQLWNYAVSFSNPFKIPLVSEPKFAIYQNNGENKNIVVFLHTSGIWITGSHPHLLNQKNIETVSDKIELIRTTEPITDFYGFNYDLSKSRVTIGKLKFLWIFT